MSVRKWLCGVAVAALLAIPTSVSAIDGDEIQCRTSGLFRSCRTFLLCDGKAAASEGTTCAEFDVAAKTRGGFARYQVYIAKRTGCASGVPIVSVREYEYNSTTTGRAVHVTQVLSDAATTRASIAGMTLNYIDVILTDLTLNCTDVDIAIKFEYDDS